MAAELEYVDVPGQMQLPGTPEEGVLFHVERFSAAGWSRLSLEQRQAARQQADRSRAERGDR